MKLTHFNIRIIVAFYFMYHQNLTEDSKNIYTCKPISRGPKLKSKLFKNTKCRFRSFGGYLRTDVAKLYFPY
jgi:hypothetical protein